MKKLMALIALVAMVAVSSVAYAQDSDNVVINASVTSTVALTGCTSVDLTGITPLNKPSDTCTVAIASNDTDGYTIDYSDTDADNDLDGATDSIAALGTAQAACVDAADPTVNIDCYSWYISTLSDGTAATDLNNGAVAFTAGEHTAQVLLSAEEIIASTNQYSGSFITTYYATVDATTEEAADYTNTTVYTITGA